MARRNAIGEGTIYRRKDGRWKAAAWFLTTSGKRKRLRVYGKTRREAHDKLTEAKTKALQGVPLPDKSWKLNEYLDYWIKGVVKVNKRPKTYQLYQGILVRYLKPGLGSHILSRLTVRTVQDFLNQQLEAGKSVRLVPVMRTVLSAALTRAMREELIVRNVARLVELPEWEPSDVHPWTADEARQFLDHARSHSLYPAFVLLLLYGLRRGEVLGLRWSDVDLAKDLLRVRQQLQHVLNQLQLGKLKTKAGKRDLPLLSLARKVLATQREHHELLRMAAGEGWRGFDEPEALIFVTKSGLPVSPDNFFRTFHQLREQAGLRRIKLHHLRHTQNTLLEALGVSPRTRQLILGHADESTTEQIYTHPNLDSQRDALERVEALFMRTMDSGASRKLQPFS